MYDLVTLNPLLSFNHANAGLMGGKNRHLGFNMVVMGCV